MKGVVFQISKSLLNNIVTIIFVFCTIIGSTKVNAQKIAFTQKRANILAHQPSLNSISDRPFNIVQLEYFFLHDDSIGFRKVQPNLQFGMQMSFIPFTSDSIGNAYGFNIKVLLGLCDWKRWKSKLDIGIGVAYVENVWDLQTNFQNLAVSSHLNILGELDWHNEFKVHKHWSLVLRGGLGHISNSGTFKPNTGINYLSFGGGVKYSFKEITPMNFSRNIKQSPKHKLWGTAFLTGNQSQEVLNPVWGFSGTYEYHDRVKSSWVVSLDVVNDGSKIEEAKEEEVLLSNDFLYSSLGIGYGMKFHLAKFFILVQNGAYLINSSIHKATFYNRVGFGYRFHPKMNAYFNTKIHGFNAQFFECSVAYDLF